MILSKSAAVLVKQLRKIDRIMIINQKLYENDGHKSLKLDQKMKIEDSSKSVLTLFQNQFLSIYKAP